MDERRNEISVNVSDNHAWSRTRGRASVSVVANRGALRKGAACEGGCGYKMREGPRLSR
jgi:hypothetical protein